MDNEYLNAITILKEILEPITDEICHINNVELARLTFPYSTIPYDVKPEIWKPLINKSYAIDKYLISSWSRVFNNNSSSYVSTHLCDKGYVRVGIERNPESNNLSSHTSVRIHKLVGMTFLNDEDIDETINHINLNKRNNTLENLEYLSNENNLKHAHENGAHKNIIRPKYLTKQQVMDIKKRYANGELLKNIGIIYDRNYRTISDIITGKTYKDDFWDNLGFTSEQVSYYKKL